LDEPLAKLRIVIPPWLIPVAAAIHFQELAGATLGHLELLDGECHIASQAGRLQP